MKRSSVYRMKLALIGCIVVLATVRTGMVRADYVLGAPINLGPTVNSQYYEDSVNISSDGLELYFISPLPGGSDDFESFDIYVTTRSDVDANWSEPENLGQQVNSSNNDQGPSISDDGLVLYFSSTRPNGQGEDDLWFTTRTSISDPWEPPINLGSTVNGPSWDYDPSISADGLELYFTSNRPGSYGFVDIWVTTRPTTKDEWSKPVNLGPAINSMTFTQSPSISSDGLALFFESDRPGGVGLNDIWMSRRATKNDLWGEPVVLGSPMNSQGYEKMPDISSDGRTLYFGHFDDAAGPWDLWQASIDPILDFNGDGIVDCSDMCIMVENWETDSLLCDVGPMPWGDGAVDTKDLTVLAEHLFEQVNDPTLVAHWALDEAQGMTARESVSGRDDWAMGNPVWQPTGGMVEGTLEFDGVDDCLITGYGINPAGGPFSILAWIKGGAPGQVIMAQQATADWLTLDAEGKLTTELKGLGRNGGPLSSEAVITDGQWHRIGLVWDGLQRMLYMDGMLVAADSLDGLESSDRGLYIGAGKDYPSGSFFSGLIDDVRIYNRAVRP